MNMLLGDTKKVEFVDAGILKDVETATKSEPSYFELKGNNRPIRLEPTAAETMFNTNVSDMQKDLAVNGYKVTGTLYKLTEGELVEGWGEGYFMGVDFKKQIPADATKLLVGLSPSQGSGLVDAINDPDKNGAWKITDPKTQKFIIQTTIASGEVLTQEFDLSGLVFEEKTEE